MFILKHRTQIILLLLLFSGLAGVYLGYVFNNTKLPSGFNLNNSFINQPVSTPIPIMPTSTPIPAPAFVAQTTTTTQSSSDGSKNLILKSTSKEDGSRTYSLYTEDENGENTNLIFTRDVDKDTTITIPYNAWAPTNKYFFIKEESPSSTDIRVYSATGEPFTPEYQYLDLTQSFKQKETGNTFQEATGWGGYGLIVFNTKNQNNEQGPSYWYEVPGQSVIHLSTLFL